MNYELRLTLYEPTGAQPPQAPACSRSVLECGGAAQRSFRFRAPAGHSSVPTPAVAKAVASHAHSKTLARAAGRCNGLPVGNWLDRDLEGTRVEQCMGPVERTVRKLPVSKPAARCSALLRRSGQPSFVPHHSPVP